MVATANTEERLVLRDLIDYRGASLAVSFFIGTLVTPAEIARIYHGHEVDETAWGTVQKVLKERMTAT